MPGPGTQGLKRQVLPPFKQLPVLQSPAEGLAGKVELDLPILPLEQQLFYELPGADLGLAPSQFIERPAPALEVDRPAVVGIDQVQVPQFGPLVEVGNAGWDPLESTCRHASLSIL